MLITLEELKMFLRIDYSDDDIMLNDFIQTTEEYIKDIVSDYDIKIKNERFKRKASLAAKFIISELYDNRELTIKENKKVNFIINSFITQMQYCNFS